jgi:protocatechuate 3,4-dioxygenase beta subunit
MRVPHVIAAVLLLAASVAGQQATARISGRVIDQSTGAPVANARVFLIAAQAAPGGAPVQTMTDADGRYVFDAVAAGRYVIDVQKTGIVAFDDGSGGRQLAIAAGEPRDEVTVLVQRSSVITGRIFDAYGEPVVDALVQALTPGEAPAAAAAFDAHARQPATRDRRAAATNDLGEFRLFGLAPGDYHLVASPPPQFGLQTPGGIASRPTYYPGVPDAASAQRLTVGAGETIGADFTLFSAPTFSVSGSVANEDGTPAAAATVILRTDPTQGAGARGLWFGQSRSDDAGRFVIAGVPGGAYYATASVSTPGGGERRLLGDPVAVSVLDGDVQGVSILVR